MSTETVRPELLSAIEAAQDKKAGAITLLDLTGLGAFTDYFLLCTGYSTPQVEAIIDAVEGALKAAGCVRCIAKGVPAPNGCCWITAVLSCTFSPSACGTFTISSAFGVWPAEWTSTRAHPGHPPPAALAVHSEAVHRERCSHLDCA